MDENDADQLSKVIETRRSVPILFEQFERFDFVEFNSERAHKMKETFQIEKQRENLRKNRRKEKPLATFAEIRKNIEEFENGDIVAWV